MKEVLSFLTELADNNNKPWFDSHKEQYKEANKIFLDFAGRLISGLSKFDKSLCGLTTKDCTYRIYKDLRFTKDKTPYKTHMGVFVCPHGKKSGYSGYYFHIEPANNHFLLCTGLYLPDPKVIKSVREEIMLNGTNFDRLVRASDSFTLDWKDSLKRIPAGYPSDKPYSDYFKLKNFCLLKNVNMKYVLSNNLLDNLISDFQSTSEFCKTMNRAVDYAFEEM